MPPAPSGAWPPAYAAKQRLLSSIQRFLEIETASGLVLIATTAVALVWANSPWASSYEALWHLELSVGVGAWDFAQPLHFWINDGLMTVFFYVVGLEIRREMYDGSLRDLRRAALPVIAAVGGMLMPAAIYAALNAGRDGHAGWAIPMATDIAFAVGVLALLGPRVSPALRVLLLALAVIDDIGAVLVIAVFYSSGINAAGLVLLAAGVAIIVVLRLAGVRRSSIYALAGIALWAGLHVAGVHPTLAGVILGLLAPMSSHATDDPAQHALHRWVAFAIMPLFALANAGVSLAGASLTGDAGIVLLGVVLGLAIGKPLGIFVISRLGIRARLASWPDDAPPRGLAVLGVVAGIGFTMSMFIAQLAFPAGPLLASAKLGILLGSLFSALLGLALGAWRLRAR